jgi:hypothetical protein
LPPLPYSKIIYEHLINTYDILSIEEIADSKKHYAIVLTFNYGHTLKHRKELTKILSIPNMKYFVLRAMEIIPPEVINPLKKSLSKEEFRICGYKLCYQITGCRRIFLDWFLDGMPLPVDKLVSMLNAMNTLKDKFYRDLPGIVVRVNKE